MHLRSTAGGTDGNGGNRRRGGGRSVKLPSVVIEGNERRFFDGGSDDEPARPGDEPTIRLEWVGDGRFQMNRRLGYRDRVYGPLVVPVDLDWETDLASVPSVLTWLVPKSGHHLPAAIVHDAMIGDRQFAPTPLDISAVEADRIFRDAMADAGTGVVRRWLVWAAVTLRTMVAREDTASSAAGRTYYMGLVWVTLTSILWLGYQATAQVVDRTGRWWCTYELPWITSELPSVLEHLPLVGHGAGARLVSGAVFAVVLPAVWAALTWGRFWRAGLIAGPTIAFLVHVTVALVALSGVYVIVEAILSPDRRLADLVPTDPRRRRGLVRALAAVSAIVGVVVAICWWT